MALLPLILRREGRLVPDLQVDRASSRLQHEKGIGHLTLLPQLQDLKDILVC